MKFILFLILPFLFSVVAFAKTRDSAYSSPCVESLYSGQGEGWFVCGGRDVYVRGNVAQINGQSYEVSFLPMGFPDWIDMKMQNYPGSYCRVPRACALRK